MDKIICTNVFASSDEAERSKAFNEAWIAIINLLINIR